MISPTLPASNIDIPNIDVTLSQNNDNPINVTKKKETRFSVLKIDGLQIDEFDCNETEINDKILLFDSFSLHSVPELHLIGIRIFELCDYVDLFVIIEMMYYPDGTKREKSIWSEKEKHINLSKLMEIKNCDPSQIIYHEIYENIYAEGYNLGKRGELLQKVYYDEIRRHYIVKLVYQDCFRYFGHNRCNINNMDNIYIILSDTDEIPRNSVVKLLKICSQQIPKPIAVETWWHSYDFGCHLNKKDSRRIKIVPFKLISPDIREFLKYEYRGYVRKFEKQLNRNITLIENGGWHLTYFGSSKQVVEKNKHKTHLFFHDGIYINQYYQKCAYEICSNYVHGEKSYRVKIIDRNNKYYPLFVTSNLSNNEIYNISPFLRQIIDVDPTLYHKWKRYWNISISHNITTQVAYCNKIAERRERFYSSMKNLMNVSTHKL